MYNGPIPAADPVRAGLADPRLTLSDVRVLQALDAARSSPFDPGPVPMSKAAAAKASGLTVRQSFRSLAKLQETGHVRTIEARGPKGERMFQIQGRAASARGLIGKRLFNYF